MPITCVTRLSDDEQIVQYIELRNNARVTGGGSIDSMSARDIDMDYTDDGQALERVALNGGAGVAMKGSTGPGRQILGESLEVRLAPDGSIVGLTGRQKVRLDLPASGDSPAGSISADALDGTGEAPRGLTMTDFRDNVEYREAGKRGATDRVVRSQSLTAMLADDALTDAAFTGRVTFEEEGLSARAAEIRYQPRMNSLALSGTDAGGGPHVSVDQISIDARTIDVGLEQRQIDAMDVKTTLNPQKGSKPSGKSAAGGIEIPGLLRQNEVANINADALDVSGHGRPGRVSRPGDPLAGRNDDPRRHDQPGPGEGNAGRRRVGELHAGARYGPLGGHCRRDPVRRREAPRDLQRRSASTDTREGLRLCRSEEWRAWPGRAVDGP